MSARDRGEGGGKHRERGKKRKGGDDGEKVPLATCT